MTEYRVEKDFLGEVKVPLNAYYGVQTMRAMTNFPISGLKLDRDMIRALGMIKLAAARSNMALGLLPKPAGIAIIEACQAVINGELDGEFPLDPIQGGAGTSCNMNANEVIANKAAEILGGQKGDYELLSPNTHVNMSQSTNDVYPTSIKIACLFKAERLIQVNRELVQALRSKAVEFDHIIKMGRTQLQDAVPIRLGQEFAAYAQAVERSNKRIVRACESLKEINMGATAIGTALNAEPKYIELVIKNLSCITGFELKRAENLIDATQNADVFSEVSDVLKTCALVLSKIANDLRLLSSGPKCGLKEINLPEVQPGSSIMPFKVNPVIPEVVNQISFLVVGNDTTISMAVEAGQLELNAMEPIIAFNLFQSFDTMTKGTRTFIDNCITGITANEKICNEMVEKSLGIVTALNPHIGYENSCAIAKEAFYSEKSVREIAAQKSILSSEEIDIILRPMEMTEPGIAGKSLLKKKIS